MDRAFVFAISRVTTLIVSTLMVCSLIEGAENQKKIQASPSQPTTVEIPREFQGTWEYVDPGWDQAGPSKLTITSKAIEWSRICEGSQTVHQGKYSVKDAGRVVVFKGSRATSFSPFPLAGKCTPATMGDTTVTLSLKGEYLSVHLSEGKSVTEYPRGTETVTVPEKTYECHRIK